MVNSTEQQQFISAELDLNTEKCLLVKVMSSAHSHRAELNPGPDQGLSMALEILICVVSSQQYFNIAHECSCLTGMVCQVHSGNLELLHFCGEKNLLLHFRPEYIQPVMADPKFCTTLS